VRVLTGLLLAGTLLIGSRASVAQEAESSGLHLWDFLLGTWSVEQNRYGFDGSLIETNAGTATFTPLMDGERIQEYLVLNGSHPSQAIHLFVYDPDKAEVEIARTDSGHYGFWVIQGTLSAKEMVLREKHPDPDSEITRRITYRRGGPDRFVRTLEFSQDGGETWFTRSEESYGRRNPAKS